MGQAKTRKTPRPAARARPPGDGAFGCGDYRDWFEHAPVGYMLLGEAGAIKAINATGATMLGWDAAWLVGRPFSRWVANNDKQLFHSHRQQVASQGEALSPELRIKTRPGRMLEVRLKTVREPPGDRPTDGYRSVLIDMSGQERAARRMRQLQSQLAHIARLQTAGELAASLAHELNQPLGSVVLNCEAAQRVLDANSSDRAELADMLAQASESASFASEIVRRLRGFLKKDEALHRVYDLPDLIQDLTALIEVDARDHDIEFSLDIERNLPAVRVDAVQIQQVLVNLVHNGIEAMRSHATGGIHRVVIRARRACPDGVEVSVADTGPGLTSAQAERVFTPFYTTKRNGVGMGLAISQTIIQAHGGQLWASPIPAQGAFFCFSLPGVTAPRDAR